MITLRRLYLLLILIPLVPNSAISATFELSQDKILYIYDGDTYYIECVEGLRCKNGKLGIRHPDIDTPEMKGKCDYEIKLARKAKKVAVELLRSADTLMIEYSDQRPYGRYKRLLGKTYVNGQELGALLLKEKLARPYGSGRKSWCD